MHKKFIFIILSLLLITTAACSNISNDNQITGNQITYEPIESIAEPINTKLTESSLYNDTYQYLLHIAKGENAVISPESLNTAIYMYSKLVTDNDALQKFTSHDYLNYKTTDYFKSINRIWINSNYGVNLHNTGLEEFSCNLDMSNSNKATKEKNNYVKKQTNNFIEKTSSVLDNSVIFDIMNIIYFKDNWDGGSKHLTTDAYEFTNKNGSMIKVPMITGFTGTTYQLDNAVEYSTYYANGFLFNVVLPIYGKSVEDIDLDKAVTAIQNKESTTSLYGDLYLPEFEITTDVKIEFEDLGLTMPQINDEICKLNAIPTIYQIAKIKVDKNGTEAAAVTESVDKAGIMEDDNGYDIVCDRPFAYYIYDTINNDIAFVGIVNNLNFT